MLLAFLCFYEIFFFFEMGNFLLSHVLNFTSQKEEAEKEKKMFFFDFL